MKKAAKRSLFPLGWPILRISAANLVLQIRIGTAHEKAGKRTIIYPTPTPAPQSPADDPKGKNFRVGSGRSDNALHETHR